MAAAALADLFVLPAKEDCLFNVCSSKSALDRVREKLRISARETNERVIAAAKKMLGKDTESEVLQEVLSYEEYMREKKRFKVDAPVEDIPLTDSQMDAVMYQFSCGFKDFYYYPFCMYNISSQPSASLNQIMPAELYEKGYRRWGCILNTDTYGGPGLHWVCLYGDMTGSDEWTIEYFNSSSRPPYGDIAAWIDKAVDSLRKYLTGRGEHKIIVRALNCPIDYQKGEGNHCGVYCLIYIWQRLNGIPYEKFHRKKISNAHVLAFRSYLFKKKDD